MKVQAKGAKSKRSALSLGAVVGFGLLVSIAGASDQSRSNAPVLIEALPWMAQDPLYVADKALHDMQNTAGMNMNEFEFNKCVFLHGPKGWTEEWRNFKESDRLNMGTLFTKVPTTKLNATNGDGTISSQFVIGPLCGCTDYENALSLASQYDFDLLGILRDSSEKLGNCLG